MSTRPTSWTTHGRGNRRLVENGALLAFSQGAAAVFGLVFWIIVARGRSEADVGHDATLIQVMLAASFFAQLNYANSLPRLLPAASSPFDLVRSVYVRTGAISLLLGVVVILALPSVDDSFAFADGSARLIVGFGIGTLAWSWFTIQDGCLAGLGQARLVAVENVAFGLLKIGLAVALIELTNGIFISWVVSTAVIVAITSTYLLMSLNRAHAASSPPQEASRDHGPVGFRLLDFAGMACVFLATALLPIIVLTQLGSEAAAHASIAMSIVWSLDGMALGATVSFTVEASRSEHLLGQKFRHSLVLFGPFVLLASFAAVALAPTILWPFGESYQDGGAAILRWLALAIPFRFVVNLLVGAARVRYDGRLIFATYLTTAVLAIPLAMILQERMGLAGVGLAWFLAQLAALAVAVGLAVWSTRGSGDRELPRLSTFAQADVH